jgi:hypothetical protein
MDDCVSRNPVLNRIYHCQNAHRALLCPRTWYQRFSPSRFGISSSQTTEPQGAHLPFFVDLVSVMCDIEYNELHSNWRINDLSTIIMTCRDMDATDRILGDFIFDHFMHLHLIVCSDPRFISIAIIKTWSLSWRFGRTLFSAEGIFVLRR